MCTRDNCANIEEEYPDMPGNKKTATDNNSLVCKNFSQQVVNVCKVANVPGDVSQGDVRGSTLPLPGVLDHRDFERMTKVLGKCDLCGKGKAVFSLKELRMSICERCFGRLMREDLKTEGVR